MSAVSVQQRHWRKRVVAMILLLVILIPAWALVLLLWIQPSSLMQEPSVIQQLMWFVAAPMLLVLALAAGSWKTAIAQSRPPAVQQPISTRAETAKVDAQREYMLEVISLGVTLDKYRQGRLWDALSTGHALSSIREQDPKKYPWSADEKDGNEGSRVNDALENGITFTPMYWGIPSFRADSPDDPKDPASPTNTASVIGSPTSSGLAWHLFIAADWQLSEHPDRLLQRVFAFFDQHPDVPYVVLSASDGFYFRNLYRPKGTPPLVKDGHYIPAMPDSSVLIVLARRERVEAMRRYEWDEPTDEGLTRKLYLAHLNLERTLPQPAGSLRRTPTVPEWIAATKAFAQREDIYPKGFSLWKPWQNHPPKDFKPTPWFPLPWNKTQLATFDRLPTLGFLHRPVFVPMVDPHGKPLTRRADRAAALAAGWQQALQTLPETERKASPARVITATAGQVEQTIALTTVLDGWAAQGGPELDPAQPTQWINTDARLGNTGAATWFMQMAIGVMGSYRDGGTSAAINLRDPAEASIVLITPPSAAKRQTQKHPLGGDVFRHFSTPAIDPDNYRN